MFSCDSRVLDILQTLHTAGFQAYLVGGCVRDALLGTVPHDYDCATSALPDEILSVCSQYHCIPTGIQHGTITVIHDGLPVEVTTFRMDGDYHDHRHPEQVSFTPELAHDLARRDFTINAMAWSEQGVVDLFGGQQDLEQKVLRCVGTPEQRFQEDALRILRGLRFAAQLGFSIHSDTASAIHTCFPLLSYVSQERITTEFSKLICGRFAEEILLSYSDVVAFLLPELAPTMNFQQHNPHHCYDIYTHSVKAMSHTSPKLHLRLAALLHDIGKPDCFTMDEQGIGHFYQHASLGAKQADQLCQRLRLDNATRSQVVTLIQSHGIVFSPTDKLIRRWLHRLGEDMFFDLLDLQESDQSACADGLSEDLPKIRTLATEILAQKPCLTLKELAVNGHDAIALGLQGKTIGTALSHLLHLVVDGELSNERTILLDALKKMAGEYGSTNKKV